MIALLNDQILYRILTLLHDQMGPPPVKYCWLLLGSEGRREQTFKTDQDNALIYADPENERETRRAHEYFSLFASRAIDHLVKCGYPLCQTDTMANNPEWCQPVSIWKSYFKKWISAADPRELLVSSIFFDFRSGYGTKQLAVELRDYIIDQTTKRSLLPYYLGRQCIANRAPLSFFNNFIVEKDGEHKNTLDIKTRGIGPFVDFARVLALRFGIRATNTLERLRLLMVKEKISKDLYHAAVDAYELQMQLRVIHQLGQIEDGNDPDNFIHPAHLTDLEKRMLRDAFGVIERMQTVLERMFPEA